MCPARVWSGFVAVDFLVAVPVGPRMTTKSSGGRRMRPAIEGNAAFYSRWIAVLGMEAPRTKLNWRCRWEMGNFNFKSPGEVIPVSH